MEEEVNEVVADPIEVTARAGGWRPKEEFTGDAKHWYPADEFLRRGDLLTEISKRGQENKQLRESVDMLARKFEIQEKQAYDKALAQLRQEREMAIDVGDRARVYDIEAKMSTINKPIEMPAANTVPTEVQDFVTKHSSWFNDSTPQNSGFKAEAIAYDKMLPQEMAISERLAKVEHYMMNKLNGHAKDPVQVQSADAKPTKSHGKKHFDHLSSDQKTICDRFIKMGVFKNRQDYVNELEKQGDI